MKKDYKKLELDKILDLLSQNAYCDVCRERIKKIKPSFDIDTVRTEIAKTDDAFTLSSKFGTPKFYNIKDICFGAKRAQQGSSLSLRELMDIGMFLREVSGLDEWYSQCSGIQTSLTEYFEQLSVNKHLENMITNAIISEEELADSASLSHGSISIGASETALNIFLLDKLKAFHMVNPGIRLKIYNHSTPEAVDAVKNGLVDFAVVSSPVYADSSLKTVVLHSFQEILVGGTTFTALGSQELSIRELTDYPLICLGRETMTFRFYKDLFMSHGVELEPDTEAATTDQILPLVKCELGLAFLPETMAQESIDKKEIVKISLKDNIPKRNICLVYDSRHPVSSAARKLRKTIGEINYGEN